MSDIPLSSLPETLRPIKVDDWAEACNWIRLRWGRTAWEDDVILYDDARYWCSEEVWGGLQTLLNKGSEFPPNFAELTKAVKEWRQNHLQHRLDEYKIQSELPAPKGSLKDYLDMIGAESFAHACYLKVQERAKNNKLEVYEDPNAYNKWTMDWNEAKATYMNGLSKSLGKSESISQDKSWDEIVAP
jgi:hypothetical protein